MAGICQTYQGTAIYGMFGIQNFENWNVWIPMCEYQKLKLKFEVCMWNVWNLKFSKLKCLNWDEWILKAEN